MAGLPAGSGVLTILDLSAKIVPLCYQYFDDVTNARDDICKLRDEVVNLEHASKCLHRLIEGSNGTKLVTSYELLVAIEDSQWRLQKLYKTLRPKTAHQALSLFGLRAFKWPFQKDDVEKTIQELGRYTHTMNLALQVDQTFVKAMKHLPKGADIRINSTILFDIDQKLALERLPIANGASFDSHAEEHNPTCLPNTRVELLRRISEWATDPNGKAIFWLSGMAGTGKSTISRTVAHSLSQGNRLGASFFFNRGEIDRRTMFKFFSTIAADLVARIPAISQYVKNAMDNNPAILRKTMREQFNKLVLEPLELVSASRPPDTGPIIIVVDGLDECEQDNDIKLLIRLFSSAISSKTVPLRLYLASRPDLPIRLGFHQVKDQYHSRVLHDIPNDTIKLDIVTFLYHELLKIRDEYNASVQEHRRLADSWPSESHIQSLATMATPLFIYAATICRFIADRKYGNPDRQLTTIMKFGVLNEASPLGATYLPVLNKLIHGLSNDYRDNAIQQFRHIIGSIVILANPLSTSALAQLLSIDREKIHDSLDMLHSVLSIPESAKAPVRLFHLSFRDFLLGSHGGTEHPFSVNGKQTHKMMADNCLRVMGSLRRNVCGLQTSSIQRLTIPIKKLDACLPSELQYACVHWVYHMQEAGSFAFDAAVIYEFLTRHFLHWLESVALMGRAVESIGLLKAVQSLFKLQTNNEFLEFLDDAIRFILANISAIDCTPLQIYSSLLLFAPNNSKVKTVFKADIPSWISLEPKMDNGWGQCIQVFEGHRGWVNSVAFSHNSELVVSGSDDKTIRMWHADTGQCKYVLEGHSDLVNAVAFSHNSELIASASLDATIRIWLVRGGQCIRTLTGHTSRINSITFSHDSALIASASFDTTARIWCASTGRCIQTLIGHSDLLTSVAFSHDSALIATASFDRTVRIWHANIGWHADAGECSHILKGHTERVSSVVISHDSAFVASASFDTTVRIWCTNTGQNTQILIGHSDRVSSAVFSHDSTVIASTSFDKTIRIWCTKTAQCIRILNGHCGTVSSAVFSHESRLIASGSFDKAIRIWSVNVDESVKACSGHKDRVSSVAISHDVSLVASASFDKTIRIWNVKTWECIRALDGHTDRVRWVVFSNNSQLIASASFDGTVRVWCTSTGKCVYNLKGHSHWVTAVAFSYDSNLVVSCSLDKTVRIWGLLAGRQVRVLEGHTDGVCSVAISRCSTLVVSASFDQSIRIWQANTGQCIQTLIGHDGLVSSVSFSWDSSFVVSSSLDKTIRIWRSDTGECMQDINLPAPARIMSFNSSTGLLTLSHGAIVLQGMENQSADAFNATLPPRNNIFSISEDLCWVTVDGENVLWLPVEFRPACWVVSESVIVMGCASGRLIAIRRLSRMGPQMLQDV